MRSDVVIEPTFHSFSKEAYIYTFNKDNLFGFFMCFHCDYVVGCIYAYLFMCDIFSLLTG